MMIFRNSRSVFLGTLLLCIINSVNGQNEYKNGYIIRNNSDTIYGLISLRSNYANSLECVYKKNSDANADHFSPGDIRAYRIEDIKYYVSKEITLKDNKTKVFLEYLLHGIVDLYYLKAIDEKYFFIEKDDSLFQLSNEEKVLFDKWGGKFLTKSGQYYGILTYLFQNSPETLKKINDTRFDYKSLINITKEYHENVCKDYKCIEYTQSAKLKIFMEPEISLIYSRMGLKSSNDFAKDLKPAIGVNFRFIPALAYHVWSIGFGVNYSSNNFSGDYKNNLLDGSYRINRVDIKYSIIRIPIMFEYSFPTKKLQPFLSAGGNISYINKPSYSVRLVNKFQFADTVIIEDIYTGLEKFQIGLQGCVGIRFKINERSHLFIKSDFGYREPLSKFSYFLDYHFVNSIQLSMGYGFSLN